MAVYILRRLILLIPTLLGITLIVFFVLELVPADPVVMILGQNATIEQVNHMRELLGLNDPFWVRYGRWLWSAVQGDFGTSIIDGRPVFAVAVERLPATLLLLISSISLSLIIGIPAGILSARFPNTIADLLLRTVSLIGLSVPSFWLAILLMLIFAVRLKILPIGGYGGWKHLVLPTIALGSIMAGLIMRMSRSAILNVMKQDYIRTAYAKGVNERVALYRHALPNALLPIVTIVGLNTGYLLGGTVIIESLFEWPGIGSYAYLKMTQRDYPAIMANLFIFALLFSLVNLATDILYSYLDPRIRYG